MEAQPMRDWAKLRAFLWSGVFGSLIGLLLAPYKRRRTQPPVSLEMWEESAGAPCETDDDGYV